MTSKPSFKCALITGATSGIGLGLAEFLKKKGIELILTGRSSKTLPLDLAVKEERAKLLDVISAKKPDLIINNAGFGLYGDCIDLSLEEQEQMIELNITALMEISIHGARELIKAGKKGTILNISSGAAFLPFPNFNVYAASKSFVTHFSLALDAELKEKGVRVLCACPGQIDTSFRTHASKGHPQKPDRRTMTIEKAVEYLWKQIEEGKSLNIFDWRTKGMIWGSKLIPRFVLLKMLPKWIEERALKD